MNEGTLEGRVPLFKYIKPNYSLVHSEQAAEDYT